LKFETSFPGVINRVYAAPGGCGLCVLSAVSRTATKRGHNMTTAKKRKTAAKATTATAKVTVTKTLHPCNKNVTTPVTKTLHPPTAKAPTEKGNLKDFFSDMAKILHTEYRQVFDNLSEEQKSLLAAFFNTELRLHKNTNGYSFKPSKEIQCIFSGIVSGALPENFDLDTLKKYTADNELSIRHDWRDRLEFMAISKGNSRGGKRPGAGRPRGGKKKNTTEQEQELRRLAREIYNLRKNEKYTYPAIMRKFGITKKVAMYLYNAHYRHYIKGKKKTD